MNLFERAYGRALGLTSVVTEYLRSHRDLRANLAKATAPIEQVLDEAECTFVLSTGRCGTELLTRILSLDRRLHVMHTPRPELVALSRRMYERAAVQDVESLRFATLQARYDLVRDCFLRGRHLVETNNRITFYAPYLAELFRRAKFIHLVRHPGEFVRSGVRRGFYLTSDPSAGGLLEPRDGDPVSEMWGSMSQIEKVAWLWNETNAYIEKFRESVAPERVLYLRSENLFSAPDTIGEVCSFLGVAGGLSDAQVRTGLRKPVNRQTTGDTPPYGEWGDRDRGELRRWVPLAEVYGHDL